MSLYRFIYDDIIKKINSGDYKEGDRLPSEIELADLYKVSRITTTRAMQELEKDLIIVRYKKKGSFVGNTVIESYNRPVKKFIPVVLPFDKDMGVEIENGAQKEASAHACVVSCFYNGGSIKLERETLQKILKIKPLGALIYPCSNLENIDILSQFAIEKIPIVFLDRAVKGLLAPCVLSDNFKGAYLLTKNLIDRGHKNTYFYNLLNNNSDAKLESFSGYINALIDNGISVNRNYIFGSDGATNKISHAHILNRQKLLKDDASKAVTQLLNLNPRPTAICCTDDISAHYIIDELEKSGLVIGKDISVTGFDNLKLGKHKYSITSIEQDFFSLGETAMDILFDILKSKRVESFVKIPVKYIEGNTITENKCGISS